MPKRDELGDDGSWHYLEGEDDEEGPMPLLGIVAVVAILLFTVIVVIIEMTS